MRRLRGQFRWARFRHGCGQWKASCCGGLRYGKKVPEQTDERNTDKIARV